jgi:UDP-N-acetylglucosamine 2-epimerase (non-hydrolysing)
MEDWFLALQQFLILNPTLGVVLPVHPNHLARDSADRHLRPLSQVHIVNPLNYGETCHLLSECEMVVTDSGGIQEEAATLGIPTVICRKTTERLEAVEALWLGTLAGSGIGAQLLGASVCICTCTPACCSVRSR